MPDINSRHKNQLYFCTLTMSNPNRKLRKQLFPIVSERIKYLGINLSKEAKDLYTEKAQNIAERN